MRQKYEYLSGAMLTCVESKSGHCIRYIPTCLDKDGKCITESPPHPKKTGATKRRPSRKATSASKGKKQPWEMTSQEWNAKQKALFDSISEEARAGHSKASYKRSDEIYAKINAMGYGAQVWSAREGGFKTGHKLVIGKAVLEGKKVPAKVRAEYSDIDEFAAEVMPGILKDTQEIFDAANRERGKEAQKREIVQKRSDLKNKNKLSAYFIEVMNRKKQLSVADAYKHVYGGTMFSVEAQQDLNNLINRLGYGDLKDMYFAARKGSALIGEYTKGDWTAELYAGGFMTFRAGGFTQEPSEVPAKFKAIAMGKLMKDGLIRIPETVRSEYGLAGVFLTCSKWQITGKGVNRQIRCKTFAQTCRPGDADCIPPGKKDLSRQVISPRPPGKKIEMEIIAIIDKRPETITRLAKRFNMTVKAMAEIVDSMIEKKTVKVRLQHGSGALVVPRHYEASLKDYESKILMQVSSQPGKMVKQIADQMRLHEAFVNQALLDLHSDGLVKINPPPPKLAKDVDQHTAFSSKVTLTPKGRKRIHGE